MPKNSYTHSARAQAAAQRRKNRKAREQQRAARNPNPRPGRPAKLDPRIRWDAEATRASNRLPLPVPWMLLRDEKPDPEDRAADGSATLIVEYKDETEHYVVFNDEGLMSEFIELIGPRGDGQEDERLLQMFKLRRRALRDPIYEPDERPKRKDGTSPRSARELHRYTYKHFLAAEDGSRMVLATDECGHEWLFAITAKGFRYDGIWLDAMRGVPYYSEEVERFFAARRAAGDPMLGQGTLGGAR